MTPTEHEKSEWSRLAQDAYARGHNEAGHLFSGHAALRRGEAISLSAFDALQTAYREWLNSTAASNEELAARETWRNRDYNRGFAAGLYLAAAEIEALKS